MNTLSPHLAKLPLRGAYVAAWKKVLRAPPGTEFRKDWHTVLTVEEAKAEFSSCVNRRVNERGGEGWRNTRTDLEISFRRDQRRVMEILSSRIRHYQFETEECRNRFGHLLADRSEDY